MDMNEMAEKMGPRFAAKALEFQRECEEVKKFLTDGEKAWSIEDALEAFVGTAVTLNTAARAFQRLAKEVEQLTARVTMLEATHVEILRTMLNGTSDDDDVIKH